MNGGVQACRGSRVEIATGWHLFHLAGQTTGSRGVLDVELEGLRYAEVDDYRPTERAANIDGAGLTVPDQSSHAREDVLRQSRHA